VIFKQPGANVIETVDRIMTALPKLSLAMPPAIKVLIGRRPFAPLSTTCSSR
jgi:multidrug efflux pump subunit AcrB